jgi:copper chaperone CopZ
MKPFLPVVLVVAAVATAWIVLGSEGPHREAAAKEVAPRELSSEPGPGEVVRVIEVEGMCCFGCTDKLHAAALAVPGVREAAVDFESGTVSALAAETVAPDALETALNFDKYTAKARP